MANITRFKRVVNCGFPLFIFRFSGITGSAIVTVSSTVNTDSLFEKSLVSLFHFVKQVTKVDGFPGNFLHPTHMELVERLFEVHEICKPPYFSDHSKIEFISSVNTDISIGVLFP